MALSPEGDLFASGSEDGAVKIWDLGGFQVDEVLMPSENQHAILSKCHNSRVHLWCLEFSVLMSIMYVDWIVGWNPFGWSKYFFYN